MTIAAMKQALEALEFSETEPHRPQYEVEASAMRALRAAIQQAEAQQAATAIACGVPGMAKTTCPYCEQGFAFEYERPATGGPVGEVQTLGDTGVCDEVRLYAPLPWFTKVYAHPASGVPEGFALVPLKATPKVAMVLYEGARSCFSPKVAEDLWQDALTAAWAQKGGQ